MIVSFKQYIDNPMGKKSSVYTQRDMYKNLYTDKWNKISLREAGKIDYKLFKNAKKEEYYIYIKIPSEVVKKFYYDVVIHFYLSEDSKSLTTTNLENYNIRFFSNDPAFVYTFAYVFEKNDLFIKDLKTKMSKRALKEKPDERNPTETIGYVKSIYFAYLYMKQKNLFSKLTYDLEATEMNFKELLKRIEHSDSKILRRQQLGAEEARRQRILNRPSPSKREEKLASPNSRITRTTKAVNNVNRVRSTNNVRSTKRL